MINEQKRQLLLKTSKTNVYNTMYDIKVKKKHMADQEAPIINLNRCIFKTLCIISPLTSNSVLLTQLQTLYLTLKFFLPQRIYNYKIFKVLNATFQLITSVISFH